MKIKICDSPVYLHSIGKSVHIDIEHPIFSKILDKGDKAFCQGKGEHGVFIALSREMAERARAVMDQAAAKAFSDAWDEIVSLSREIGWDRVSEMMQAAKETQESPQKNLCEGDQEPEA